MQRAVARALRLARPSRAQVKPGFARQRRSGTLRWRVLVLLMASAVVLVLMALQKRARVRLGGQELGKRCIELVATLRGELDTCVPSSQRMLRCGNYALAISLMWPCAVRAHDN